MATAGYGDIDQYVRTVVASIREALPGVEVPDDPTMTEVAAFAVIAGRFPWQWYPG